MNSYVRELYRRLYGAGSVFTVEEQAAMKRGYTSAERVAESGKLYGAYPQAISQGHADKLDQLHSDMRAWRIGR